MVIDENERPGEGPPVEGRWSDDRLGPPPEDPEFSELGRSLPPGAPLVILGMIIFPIILYMAYRLLS